MEKRKSEIMITKEEIGQAVNRKYKDILFRFVLADKKALLSLYNALNGTGYEDENELEINTLQDVIYLGYKNDLSFIIGNTLNLYEHQSTVCPNLPFRGLRYISMIYSAYVEENGLNEYGTKLIRLPKPNYIVFYCGVSPFEETRTLRLSDAFMDVPGSKSETCLEFTATVININYGNNKELLSQCRALEEYASFNHQLRIYLGQGIALKKAIRLTIDYCISGDILRDILRKNKAEIMEMMLTEYDEKKHHETIREEGREDGHKEGMAEGKAEGILEILSDVGEVSADLRAKIMAEKELSLLSKWLKLSARSESIDDFMARM